MRVRINNQKETERLYKDLPGPGIVLGGMHLFFLQSKTLHMSEAKPSVIHLPEQQKFIIELEGGPAYLEYELGKDGSCLIMHTEVPAAHSGKGYASCLAKEALAYVQEQGLKVMPYCTYMATYLIRHRQQYEPLFAPDFKPV